MLGKLFDSVSLLLDPRLECILKSGICPYSLEVLHHGLLEQPHLIEELGLDEERLAKPNVFLHNFWYLYKGFLVK